MCNLDIPSDHFLNVCSVYHNKPYLLVIGSLRKPASSKCCVFCCWLFISVHTGLFHAWLWRARHRWLNAKIPMPTLKPDGMVDARPGLGNSYSISKRKLSVSYDICSCAAGLFALVGTSWCALLYWAIAVERSYSPRSMLMAG